MSDLYEIGLRRDGKEYHVHARRLKRAERKGGVDDPCYTAHCNGIYDAEWGRGYKNHYPPGKRHKNYRAAYDLAMQEEANVR